MNLFTSTRLFAVAILMMVFVSTSAYAQESVRLRGGEHKNYSRIVMDWSGPAPYTLSTQPGGIYKLEFKRAAQLDMAPLNVGTLSRVRMVSESQESPLIMTVELAPGHKLEIFSLGSKLVLDAKKGKQAPAQTAQKDAPASAGKPEPATAEVVKAKPTVTQTPPMPAAPLEEAAPSPTPADNAPTEEVLETQAKKPQENTQDLLKQAIKESPKLAALKRRKITAIDPNDPVPNAFTVSTVSSTEMAFFRLNNKLWAVNNNTKTLISPQIAGSQKDDIGPLQVIEEEQAKIFKINHLQNAYYKAEGGGLVWRFLISSAPPKNNVTLKPIRRAMYEAGARGGTVTWPMKHAGNVIDLLDPVTGRPLKVVTVSDVRDYSGPAMEFVDFKVLPAALGLAIMPKVDDLEVKITEEGVQIYRKAGLALTSQANYDIAAVTSHKKQEEKEKQPTQKTEEELKKEAERRAQNLYRFQDWIQGPGSELRDYASAQVAALGGLSKSGQIETLINLAQSYVAHGMGAEALGYLTIAQDTFPDLENSPPFQALKGVALALNNRPAESFEVLSNEDSIKDKEDVRYWRSYALAQLEDWQQAERILPQDIKPINNYPPHVAIPLALTLAEVALRAGDEQRSYDLLSIARNFSDDMTLPFKASLLYLRGERYRQSGDFKRAERYWKQSRDLGDDLYRVKADLALTHLEKQQKKIGNNKVIDRLERVRYAWRGDDLEANVSYWLGRAYFEDGQYVKGLNIMRDAAGFASGPHLGQRITADMTEEFQNIYLSDHLTELPAPDAGALYERFSELVPQDERGDEIGRRLADHLINAHLFEKASEILSDQLENRAQGDLAYKIAMDLSSMEQKRRNYTKSLEYLKTAESYLNQSDALKADSKNYRAIVLQRAAAWSRIGREADALDLLFEQPPTTPINKLRVDIAWRYGSWADAAEALQYLLDELDTDPNEDLTPQQADLLLRRAVALNLGGDRIRLANLRESYSIAMHQTKFAKSFEIVTRPRQNAILTDRDTLLSIVAETDLFNGFLEEEEELTGDK